MALILGSAQQAAFDQQRASALAMLDRLYATTIEQKRDLLQQIQAAPDATLQDKCDAFALRVMLAVAQREQSALQAFDFMLEQWQIQPDTYEKKVQFHLEFLAEFLVQKLFPDPNEFEQDAIRFWFKTTTCWGCCWTTKHAVKTGISFRPDTSLSVFSIITRPLVEMPMIYLISPQDELIGQRKLRANLVQLHCP